MLDELLGIGIHRGSSLPASLSAAGKSQRDESSGRMQPKLQIRVLVTMANSSGDTGLTLKLPTSQWISSAIDSGEVIGERV